MNNTIYNNIINNTLERDKAAQGTDSLETARAVFNNMGVALPSGDMGEVYETLKTNDYMGWRACTAEEAQAAADRGVAAMGVSEEGIVILAANDEDEPIEATASVMTLSNDDTVSPASEMEYYAYSYGTTDNWNGNEDPDLNGAVVDKPYDPAYGYTIAGNPNNISEEQYYQLLSTYSHELRSDMVFNFTFNEIDSLRSYLIATMYKNSTDQQWEAYNKMKQDIMEIHHIVGQDIASYFVPVLGYVFSAIEIVDIINSIGACTMEDNLRDIADCIENFTHILNEGKSVPKASWVGYKISLLQQNPNGSWQIMIESSEGDKDIYGIRKDTYQLMVMLAAINAHYLTIYKVAPEWHYTY